MNIVVFKPPTYLERKKMVCCSYWRPNTGSSYTIKRIEPDHNIQITNPIWKSQFKIWFNQKFQSVREEIFASSLVDNVAYIKTEQIRYSITVQIMIIFLGDNIHRIVQIKIIIMIVTWKTVMSSWNSSIVLARFCSSINLENFGIRTDNCRSSWQRSRV